jgi:hypothetical protein
MKGARPGVWPRRVARFELFAGALARRHRAAYSGIDDVDYLVAASAIVADAGLLTTNVRAPTR